MTASDSRSGRRARLLLLVFILPFASLTGCTDAAEQPPASAEAPPAGNPTGTAETTDTANVSEGLSPERMAQWTRNCALCHVRGEGGAPVLGDREAWKVRWAQGEALLLNHTVEGLNNMPPLGYCMDCEEADFLALIRFMGADR